MSILQAEVPTPGQALAALRRRQANRPAPGPSAKRPTGPHSARGSRAIVGLDIESGYLAAVQAAPGSVAVRQAAYTELAADLVRDGEIIDPIGLAGVLKDFFATHKLTNRVRIGLANQQIVMRTIDLPPITDQKQLASAVRFQAQEHIAMPLDQAVLEHQSLGLVGTADGPRSRVVLVAARREMVDRVAVTAREAGLRLEGIDLSAFALIRALYRADDGDAPVAYLNVGSSTNLAVAAGAQCRFTRVMPVGGDTMVGDLAARCGLTLEHSRAWLRHVGLTVPVAEVEGQEHIVSATREVLEEGVSRVASEIRATLDFYAGQSGTSHAERVVASGPAVAIPGFTRRLGVELELPVEMRNVAEALPGALAGIDPSHLGVAAGLTLTEAPA